MKKSKTTISVIGAGNVATVLANAFAKKGCVINAVYSRRSATAKKLASELKCESVTKISSLPGDSDIYLIAVPDDEIRNVAESLPLVSGIVVHTSGTKPLNALSNQQNIGVIYPLQTLSAQTETDLNNVPFCIEGNSPAVEKTLVSLCRKISNEVKVVDSEKRRVLHLAAVIASNFSNHLYLIASEVLKKEGLSFSMLGPLTNETARKAIERGAKEAQTGPARRGDNKTLKTHKKMIGDKSLKKLYSLLSESITKTYSNK